MSETTRAPIVRVGVDIAKQVIHVHAVDAAGRRVVARAIKRDQFLAWCAQLPPGCLVAMEACGGAHHWARRLVLQLKERVGWEKACVALANKNARILWAVMTREAGFDAAHVSVKPGAKVKPADSPPASSPPAVLPGSPPAMCT